MFTAWLRASMTVLLLLGAARPLIGQTTVFSDDFDPLVLNPFPSCDNAVYGDVSGAVWPVQPDRVNGYPTQQLIGSEPCHRKNHTGPFTSGGTAFEVNSDPYPYASYHEFDPQTGILRLSAWVWEDVESRVPKGWPNNSHIAGMVGLTSEPSEPILGNSPCNGQITQIRTYEDFAFIGVEAFIPTNKPNVNDPAFDPFNPAVADQFCYRWWTKTDGWNLTLDPNTGHPVPRRVDFRSPAQVPQTWRHVEIEIAPYSGAAGDIKFYIDGVLVGQGHRDPAFDFQGVPFRRIQLGTRFATQADVSACRPPYSYEHFWFDDVLLASSPAPSPCKEPRFDVDGDTDVDMEDFARLQLCYTGPSGIGFNYLNCHCFDADVDHAIDEADFAAFQACGSQAAVAADAACDDALPPP